MKNITIIVPLHVYEEELLQRALSSVPTSGEEYTLLFVGPKDVCDKAEKLAKKLKIELAITKCENDETDFVSQINKSVFQCTDQYFTILEYDDKFTDIYFRVMQRYFEEHPEFSVILPLNEYHNEEGEIIAFGNEIALGISFSDTPGVISSDELDQYMDFNCTGGLFKTEDFISLGCLKKSLKIASWYEFLLRAAYKSKKIYVIPKIGYEHTVGRKGSYMVEAQKTITQEEGRFLITTAKQEYFFKEDRNKRFEDAQNNKEEEVK